MNQRERTLAALRHELPDRIPTWMWIRPEMARELQAELCVESFDQALATLGIDTWASYTDRIVFPEFETRVNGILDGDCPYAGGRFIMHDRDTFEDGWGVVRRRGRDGKLVQWITGPLVGAESVTQCDFPGPDRIVVDPHARETVTDMKNQGRFVWFELPMPFKTAWELRGLEQVLIDYHLQLDLLQELYDRIFALETARALEAARAGVDCIALIGDIAMQSRLFLSPAKWRSVDKPRLAHMISTIRGVRPQTCFFIHSDGNLLEVLPDLIDIGFTIINPIQPECMDPALVKRLYGDQISLHGTIGIQKTLPFGSPEDVRREVTARIEECGYNGGLFIGAANEIMYDTPVRNIITLYETARDYDLTRLPEAGHR